MPDPAAASVPGYQYDVFVSYAQANDHEGWVTTFKDKLTAFLNELLDEEPQVFWDEESIRLNDELDSKIAKAIKKSAVMVVVVSHKYLKRPWCSMERDLFLQHGDARRVMIVRYDDVPFEEFQKVLPKCVGIPFFDDSSLPLDSGSHEYKKRLHKLRTTIFEEIKVLNKKTTRQKFDTLPSAVVRKAQDPHNGSEPVPDESKKPLVFVAPVSPSADMISRRDELVSFLKDCGIATTTPSDYYFLEPDFPREIASCLGQCNGFVQLLDSIPIPQPPTMSESVERYFLNQAALQEALPILRWRREKPVSEQGDFHDLALEANVRPFEFMRFCELVRDEARSHYQSSRAKSKMSSPGNQPILVLRFDAEDQEYCAEIEKQLPAEQLDLMDVPSSAIKSLDDVASEFPAGGMLVIYRHSHAVLRRIQELRAFTASQAAHHWILGFWNSPEDPAKAIRPRSLKNVHVIDGGDTAALSEFVDALVHGAVSG